MTAQGLQAPRCAYETGTLSMRFEYRRGRGTCVRWGLAHVPPVVMVGPRACVEPGQASMREGELEAALLGVAGLSNAGCKDLDHSAIVAMSLGAHLDAQKVERCDD